MKFFKWLWHEIRVACYVPKHCQNCENLGICRDEANHWQCRHGCIELQEQKKILDARKKDEHTHV